MAIALTLAGCSAPPPRPAPPETPPATSTAPAPDSARAQAVRPAAEPPGAVAPDAARDAPRMRGLREGAEAACPPEFSGTCYPVWFGTNRRPLDPARPERGFGSERDDRMHFGKRFVRIPASHRIGELGSPLWKRLLTGVDDRITIAGATVLDESSFVREVRAFLGTLDPNDRNVLVYIHGFNTSFDHATRRAAQLGFDLRVPGITALYSWPSRGSLAGYTTDVAAIEASEDHIAEFLVKMSAVADRGKVHIIAHSMGNRGLLRAMHRATTQAALRSGVRFGQIFLAAPDVDSKVFRELAVVYPRIAERTTLYVADQDKAIAAVEWLSPAERVGGAPPVLVLPGIDTVRVRGEGLFRIGHSYVAEELDVLRDIRALLHFGESPARRSARYGWPLPDTTPGAAGAWIIGK